MSARLRIRGGGDDGYITPPYPPSPDYSPPPTPVHVQDDGNLPYSLPMELAAWLLPPPGSASGLVGAAVLESSDPDPSGSEPSPHVLMTRDQFCQVLSDMVYDALVVDMGYQYSLDQVVSLVEWRMQVVDEPFEKPESYVDGIVEHVLRGALD